MVERHSAPRDSAARAAQPRLVEQMAQAFSTQGLARFGQPRAETPLPEGIFTGLDRVNGQPVALVRHGDQVRAHPISEVQAHRLRLWKIGEGVRISGDGVKRIRGHRL